MYSRAKLIASWVLILRRHLGRAVRSLIGSRSVEFGLSAAIHHIVFIVVGGLGSVPGRAVGALLSAASLKSWRS